MHAFKGKKTATHHLKFLMKLCSVFKTTIPSVHMPLPFSFTGAYNNNSFMVILMAFLAPLRCCCRLRTLVCFLAGATWTLVKLCLSKDTIQEDRYSRSALINITRHNAESATVSVGCEVFLRMSEKILTGRICSSLLFYLLDNVFKCQTC